MRLGNDHGLIGLSVIKIAFGRVGFQLGKYVPDSGQEHTADGDDGFLVTTPGFDPAVAFLALRVLVGFDDSVCHLNQEGFEVSTGARDTGGFAFAATLVVARTATRPRAEVLCRREHGHIHADFGNKLIVPTSAVRDEGTSYHYAEPTREINADEKMVKVITDYFDKNGIEYLKGKTWTTDALYRETKERTALRKAEGCVTVEMEASALMAVAQYKGVDLGQILYAGDDLSGVDWDRRADNPREAVREKLLEITLDIALEV